MKFVVGFVLPVPKKNLKAYRSMAKLCGKVWCDHGALSYTESIADDVKPGRFTSFPQSVKLKKNETVILAWVVYKSRAHSEQVTKKAMKDPRMAKMMDPKKMPFDGMRMFWGGFKIFLSL